MSAGGAPGGPCCPLRCTGRAAAGTREAGADSPSPLPQRISAPASVLTSFPIISLPPTRPPSPALSICVPPDPCPKLHTSPCPCASLPGLTPCAPRSLSSFCPCALSPSRLLASAQPPSESCWSRFSPFLLLFAPEGSPCLSLLVPVPILSPTRLPVPPVTLCGRALHPALLPRTVAPRPHTPYPHPRAPPHPLLLSFSHLAACCCSHRTQRPGGCPAVCCSSSNRCTCPPSHPGAPGSAPPGIGPGGCCGGCLPRASWGAEGGSRWEVP